MKKDEMIDKYSKQQENNNKELIRQPKQARSIETKQKIIKTALKLFCQKGFYKTTTNEIAKEAGVPIGSLYSYFKNKNMIILEILDDYNQTFINKVDILDNPENIEIARKDKKTWIHNIIQILIEIHEDTKELNLELQALYHSMPEVATIHEAHDLGIKERIMKGFEPFKDELKITDFEASAIVTNDIISSVVDRIVFSKNIIDRERILNCGVDAIYKYLFC